MQLPVIEGTIARRLLVNYRVDPEVVARLLPAPFRPQLVGGAAIAGICLIRLQSIRPRHLPGALGLASENAAHRIAVEWGEGPTAGVGVYVPRRDTNSRMNALAGGRLFPGRYHHAHFATGEEDGRLSIALRSDDGGVRVAVAGRPAAALPPDSAFASLEEASRFFEAGSLGYSATDDPRRFDGMELRSRAWKVEPFAVESVASSFFDDAAHFPPGTATFDCALLMRDIQHEWHGRGQLRGPEAEAATTSAPAPIARAG